MMNTKNFFSKLDKQFSKDSHDFIELIPKCERFSSDQIGIIYKALYKAMELHEGQMRKNGEPYINHPIAVASILAIYGFDYETIVGALLHDLVEDTDYTLEECSRDFGPVVASLVDGVTKIRSAVNTPTHKKILDGAEKDIRIIAIKLADRLHNMYTLSALSYDKRKKIATETRDFYVPITKILGIYQLKDELQDLCLYHLSFSEFCKYHDFREKLKQENNENLKKIGMQTQELLSKEGIGMQFNHRVKNVGGIYEAVLAGEKKEAIDDLLAVKMIVNDQGRLKCYDALGVVHDLYKPIPDSFVDHIATPKNNGYQSLNTNVLFNDKNIQIRIRNEEMQAGNDLGVFSDHNLEKNVTDEMRAELKKLKPKV